MDVKVKEFLVLSAVGLVGVAFYLLRRKAGSKRCLGLKEKAGVLKSEKASFVKVEAQPEGEAFFEAKPSSSLKKKTTEAMFNYNGYSWNAYEVLGVSVDSSLERVKEAFDKSVAELDPESQFFAEIAYKTIQNHLESERSGSGLKRSTAQ